MIAICLAHTLSKDVEEMGANKLRSSASGLLELKRQHLANGTVRITNGQRAAFKCPIDNCSSSPVSGPDKVSSSVLDWYRDCTSALQRLLRRGLCCYPAGQPIFPRYELNVISACVYIAPTIDSWALSLNPQSSSWMAVHHEMVGPHHCLRELLTDAKRKHNSFLLGPSCVTICASGIKIEALFIANENVAKRK